MNFDKLPSALKAAPYFLVWRLTQIPGERKPRKIPHYANGAKRTANGSEEDRAQLVPFDRAVAACERGNYSGIGFALLPDCGIVALDFDNVVVDGRVEPWVLATIEGTYAEFSPSGNGVRAFFKGSARSRKSTGVEVFGDSGFVTCTGNQIPEVEMLGWDEVIDITPRCSEFITDRFGGDLAEIDLFAALKPPLDLTPDEIQRTLDALPLDLDYDSWLKVGMAAHHQGCDFEVWHAWSKKSPKYTTREYCEARWRSFGKGGGMQITFAWVIKQAGVKLQREAVDATKSYRQMIAEVSDEFELRTRVAGLIRGDDRLQQIDRSMLAQALQERFAALGAKLPIADVRKLLAPRAVERALALPEWGQGWVYVATEDKFLRVGTDVWVTKAGFDAQFTRHMPRGDSGEVVKQASAAVLEDLGMPTVERALYVPWADLMFEYEGQACVNRYRADSAPEAADSTKGFEKVVVDHINTLCGGRAPESKALIQWLAWNVQNPGKKVRWSPLIKGVEGDGKSVLGELLQGVMGQCNVKQISPKVIGTDFTGWAEGACVGVLEELKLTGHNRHDVLNALKPYITNSTVEVHRKGRDTYNAHNTQNYIAFTNHADALPLNDNDRRWFIIFTPWSNRDELAAHVGGLQGYFKRLFDTIHGQPAHLRRWLLDVDLTGFEPDSAAPLTDEKAEMVALSVTDDEDTVREVIEAGGEGVGQEVLSSPALGALLRVAGIDLQTTSVNRTLLRLGWSKVPNKVKWRGAAHRVWTRGSANRCKDAETLRILLEKTVPSSGCDDLF